MSDGLIMALFGSFVILISVVFFIFIMKLHVENRRKVPFTQDVVPLLHAVNSLEKVKLGISKEIQNLNKESHRWSYTATSWNIHYKNVGILYEKMNEVDQRIIDLTRKMEELSLTSQTIIPPEKPEPLWSEE